MQILGVALIYTYAFCLHTNDLFCAIRTPGPGTDNQAFPDTSQFLHILPNLPSDPHLLKTYTVDP